jgi:hypothetical protein
MERSGAHPTFEETRSLIDQRNTHPIYRRSEATARTTSFPPEKRDSMQEIIDCLAANKGARRIDNCEARVANKPTRTGVTEAACKTVVNTRMKRTGIRFEYHGGQTAMLLRTARLSERFLPLMSIMTRTYTATVEPKMVARRARAAYPSEPAWGGMSTRCPLHAIGGLDSQSAPRLVLTCERRSVFFRPLLSRRVADFLRTWTGCCSSHSVQRWLRNSGRRRLQMKDV